MTFFFPKQGAPITTQGQGLAVEWRRFFDELRRDLGMNSRVPVHRKKFFSSLGMSNIDGLSYANYEGTLKLVNFGSSGTETLYFSWELPNEYFNGTDLVPYITWAPTTATGGDTVWQIAYSIQQKDAGPGAEVAESVTSSSPATSKQLTTKQFNSISGSGLVSGTSITCALSRLGASSSDTYSSDAMLYGFGFSYRIDGTGTRKALP